MLVKTIKFIFSGGTAALTNLAVFYILITFFNFHYILASIISFSISVVVGFYLQKYVTFKHVQGGSAKRQLAVFTAISLVNLVINLALMIFFVEALDMDKLLAKVLTLWVLACWNFFLYEKFVFKVNVVLPS